MQNSMFVNMIRIAQAYWCGQALYTMAKHCFTPLSEAMLHCRGTAERLFWNMFIFLGVQYVQNFHLWMTMLAYTETLGHQTHQNVEILTICNGLSTPRT